eukprot:43775_1
MSYVAFFIIILFISATISKNVTCNPEDNDGNCIDMYPSCYYHEYLQLEKILNANKPRSGMWLSEPAHDEHLFITIHQAYELWFKQILYELESVIDEFADHVSSNEIMWITNRFNRVNVILKLLVEQWGILDTMTPLDYLDFRKYLKPASGFQSVQFRIFENVLGLDKNKRMKYKNQDYTNVLSDQHKIYINAKYDPKKTLWSTMQKWLERFPLLEGECGKCDWSFWDDYKHAVHRYIDDEKDFYSGTTYTGLKIETFDLIFNEEEYERKVNLGEIRLSYSAMKAALMIMLYRDEPILHGPYRIIQHVMDMDNLLTQWRNKHALMVKRMLGSKMGTGGSSGYKYLRTAVEHHAVFSDYFRLSTYMIPKSHLPELPQYLISKMNFPK